MDIDIPQEGTAAVATATCKFGVVGCYGNVENRVAVRRVPLDGLVCCCGNGGGGGG